MIPIWFLIVNSMSGYDGAMMGIQNLDVWFKLQKCSKDRFVVVWISVTGPQ